METVTLGRTGRTVSRLGFGGAPAGLRNYLGPYDPGQAGDREAVVKAVRRAAELGVTYFDTAAGYGEGASERIFGEGLDGVSPDRVFVATKFGMGGAPVRRSVERSLANLRRDALDLIQIHGGCYTDEDAEAVLRPGGVLAEMERLRDEGLVRHLGFTVEAMCPAAYRFVATGRFDVVQMQYNLMFQHPYDPSRNTGLMVDAERQQMGVVTMRTVTSGTFQRWLARTLPGTAGDCTPDLIQFVLSNPLVDVALVGMRTAAEVEANVRIVSDPSGRLDLRELYQRYV